MPIFVVADATAFGGKVILVPPFVLGFWRQRQLARFLAANQIAAHRHHDLAAFGPKRRDDVGRPRSPIETGKDCLVDPKSIHERGDIRSNCGRLAIPERFGRKKACRAVAAHIRHDHPVPRQSKQGRDIDETVNVVRPAVEEDDGRPAGGAGFRVPHVKQAGIDLLQRTERALRAAGGSVGGYGFGELRCSDGHGCRGQDAAAVLVDGFSHGCFSV